MDKLILYKKKLTEEDIEDVSSCLTYKQISSNKERLKYVKTFITECNKGVLTHRLSYPIGFIPMIFIPGICAFTIALPVAVVNLFLNILQ